MKNILSIICTFALNILKTAFWSVILSGFFCLCKWIGSLLSICDNPTLANFLGGGMGLFVVLFLHRMFWIIRDMRRRIKDPVYDQMANATGISYKDYKRLNKDNK